MHTILYKLQRFRIGVGKAALELEEKLKTR
jgi:hypothetical protein